MSPLRRHPPRPAHRLAAGLLCLSWSLAILPLDKALGTPCPGARCADEAQTKHSSPESTDEEHRREGDHDDAPCPDHCHCLCCPSGRILHPVNTAPRLAPPQVGACDASPLKTCKPGEFVDRIFHPPRRA